MNINAARSDDIKARMTCIGQKSPAILSAHIHLWYMCQSALQNFSVRSKSHSAVYCHRSGLLLFMRAFMLLPRAVFDLCELLYHRFGLFLVIILL